MSKPMKKSVKVFLAVVILVFLLGLCFLSVAIYAKREFEKERSWIPPKFPPQQTSVTEYPDNIHDAYTYVMRLYDEAVRSDIVEGSCHTDVDLSGEMSLPFDEVDNNIINEIRGGAAGAVQAFYPSVGGVKAENGKPSDMPVIDLQENEILKFNYDPDSLFDRKGNYRSDVYEIVFKVDPSFEKIEELKDSEVYKGVCESLKDAMTVNDAQFDLKEVEIRFRVDRLTDRMQSVDIYRNYDITADVTLTDAYAELSGDSATREYIFTIPYKATEKIEFMWYGLRFTMDYMEQRPDDITTLPLDIRVNGESVQGEDFVLSFDVSAPETLTIDKDAVMTVNKTNDVSDTEGVVITASMEYLGKTFSDDMIVYITELEKTETGMRFWDDAPAIAVGETLPLPFELRIPVNEQSEHRTEEEYELTIEVSDPNALSVEVDGKDLYATALRSSSSPVTVMATLKCGGHTYTAELPVTITEAKEASSIG